MNQSRSLPEVFTDLIRQLATLMRTEAQLARTEMSEKITQVGAGIGLIVGGAVLVMPGLVILLQAAVAALANAGIDDAWAALIVGGGVVAIGFLLLIVGMSRLKPRQLLPNRTIEQVQRDASVAKQQVRKDNDSLQRAA